MIESICRRKKKKIIVFSIILFLLLYIIVFLLTIKKIDYYFSLMDDYDVDEVIKNNYEYFQENEKSFNEMVKIIEENDIKKISRKKDLYLENEFEIDGLYFYSNKDLDLSQLSLDFSFFKKSFESMYFSNNYYYFSIVSDKTYSLNFVYCKENCNFKDYRKEVSKGDMTRYSISKKINDNWEISFSDLPL